MGLRRSGVAPQLNVRFLRAFMKLLGIRTAPQQLRYALIDTDGNTCTLLNASTENALKLPAAITCQEAQLKWVKDELSRIIRQNTDIEKIALKVPEFAGTKNSSSRFGDYLDAMVLLSAAESEIPIITKLYSQMATKRADVKRHAEERVGKTSTGWNDQMADAIIAAWILRK